MRKINILLTVLISIAFILLGVFVFRLSYQRAGESFLNVGMSFQYYIKEIFGIKSAIEPTVGDYSNIIGDNTTLPTTEKGFGDKVSKYFSLLFNGNNFKLWGYYTAHNLSGFAKLIILLLPCLLLLFYMIKKLYLSPNTKHNVDTKPLKIFKVAVKSTYSPIKDFIKQYIDFIKDNSIVWKLWLMLWVFHLNLATIILEFIAYYLYFAVSYRFDTIYTQFRKLFIDLQVVFRAVPWWGFVIVGWVVFTRLREKTALRRLRHFEARNCGFINELPIVSIACGSMGKKKTTMITDITLSQEVMFRQKALEILQNNDMKFPFFPWICFELELRKCMEYGTVFNLATVKEWVNKKRRRFERHFSSKLQLYGYDYAKYGLSYDDGLKISGLFDVLETYALSCFIYIIQSSLIVSNYSIRTDNRLIDEGNFPIWICDFFPKGYSLCSRHSHILDFDILRLGKKVIENNPKAGSFEFGVVSISEIGKERGNNLELREIKKATKRPIKKTTYLTAGLRCAGTLLQ